MGAPVGVVSDLEKDYCPVSVLSHLLKPSAPSSSALRVDPRSLALISNENPRSETGFIRE